MMYPKPELASFDHAVATLSPRRTEITVDAHVAVDAHSRCDARNRRVRTLQSQQRSFAGWQADEVKYLADRASALAAIAPDASPMLLIAIAIWVDSPRPVLVRQRRTGGNGCDSRIPQFRAMRQDAADHEIRQQIIVSDNRITEVGAVLRCVPLDELPQLLNILAGDMSSVGSRPHAPGTQLEARLFDEIDVVYAVRCKVKFGLIELAQVRGRKRPIDEEDRLLRCLECASEYIDTWSLVLDAAILARTLVAVAGMKNAC